MDDISQPAESPAPSPAKGKTATTKKTSGRGVTKKPARKPAPKTGGRGKGRGRNKTYDDSRVQAAHERQKELRELYGEVTGAIKPALEEMADQTIKKLIENPTAHQEVSEYQTLQKQLDDQLAKVISDAEQEFTTRSAVEARTYELNTKVTQKKFEDSFDYQMEGYLDGALNRTTILAELRREGIDLSLGDYSYKYVEEPDEILDEQGPYVVFRNGIEVPEPHLLGDPKKPVSKGRKTKSKRKADDQPDGQPNLKKVASMPRPRHIGGLLAAEKEPDGEPESNAPSPTPAHEGQSPTSEEKAEAAKAKKDLPDLPSTASEPDPWGVRTVNRRGPKANNRLVVPQPFQWDNDEIGFRDSTNDSTRKATRATRGKFLNKPNSRNFHVDRIIWTYDCLDYEDGDLNPALLKKHNLHPKLGLFMADSVNDWESPSERVDGTQPVVVLTPNGHTLHASRTVRVKKMDHALEMDAKKETMSSMLKQFCEKEEIDSDDIVTEQMRERERLALERLADISEEEESVDGKTQKQTNTVDDWLARERANQLLHAAASLDIERPPHPTNQRSTRPYDAVRDVFTSTEPLPPAPPMPTLEVDTTGLSCLADVAEHISHQPEHVSHHPSGHVSYEQEHVDIPATGDSSMIDPRLLGPSNPAPAPSNAFLQTALNPTTTFAHIAPAPAPGMEAPQLASAGRNPFTTPGNIKGSPVLPPLRPSRRDKAPDAQQQAVPPPPQLPTQPQPQEFGSPRGFLQTNSGNFYAPAPPRPFHQGYSIHEPTLMPMPMPQGPPMSGAGMMPNQPPPPAHRATYPLVMSPPIQGHSHLASMSQHIGPGPSVSPPGPSMMTSSSPAHGHRHRQSLTSNGNNAAKYRKIAAAPIPHNRPWPPNGGTELRLAHYDHKEAIKDYSADAPTPRTGPTQIRGWNVNNVSKARNRGVKKEDSEEKEPPSITPFINKWNPADKGQG